MAESTDFFEKHADFYHRGVTEFDYFFINFVNDNKKNKSSLLDIGGGSGSFSKLVIQNCPGINNVTILDPSAKLLSKIDDNLHIKKVVGSLPDEVPINSTFDFIQISNVLHHITGKTGGGTKLLLKKSLSSIKDLLNEDGFLLLQENFYEGYLIPTLPRSLIFYLLSIQNKLNVKVPVDGFILGLEAYFYTRDELRSELEDCGFEIIHCKTYPYNEEKKPENEETKPDNEETKPQDDSLGKKNFLSLDSYFKLRKFALIKKGGQVIFVAKKKRENSQKQQL